MSLRHRAPGTALLGLSFTLLGLAPITGCAATLAEQPAFSAYAPRTPARITSAAASKEADQVVESFYGPGDSDRSAAIEAALRASPDHPGLHEIAGYQSILKGAPDTAFEHFYAAAADTGAPAPQLALWEMMQATNTVSQHLKSAALLEVISNQHADPSVRAFARFSLAQKRHLFGVDAAPIVAPLGFVPAFAVIGPFDNDQGKGFAAEYPPETSPDRTAEVQGLALKVHWKPVNTAPFGVVELGDLVYSGEGVVYLETNITTQVARDLELRLTSSSAVRAWINGALVASEEKLFHEELDNLIVKARLEKGVNRLLLKIGHRSGNFRLGARFTERGGAPAPGLQYEVPSSPAPVTQRGARPASDLNATPSPAVAALSANRKSFLLGRISALQGHTRRSFNYFEPFLSAAPKNPLATYFTSLANWDLGELGKTLDLLSRGATAYPYAPGFLVKRGRFYAQRKLWDKARLDLEAALRINPSAREAEMELAQVHGARGFGQERCATLEQAVAAWPDSVSFLISLGECVEDRGEYPAARQYYQRARTLMPGSLLAGVRLLDMARKRMDEGESLSLVRNLRALSPTTLSYAIEESNVLWEFNHKDEALRILSKVAEQAPDSPKPRERLGDFAFARGDRSAAESYYRKALERNPQDARLAERLDILAPGAKALADQLAVGDDEIERAIQSADKIVPNPGSHYALLLDDEVLSLNADGSSKRFVTLVTQVLTTEGRDALIQSMLPASGRVRVLDAYAVKRGGEPQEASSITGALVRFRSLEIGSIVVIRYVHYAPAQGFLPNEFATSWSFQAVNAQTERARWKLLLDKDRPLRFAIQGDVKSATETRDGLQIRTFTADHIPPLVQEPNMPSLSESGARVWVSTLASWDSYVAWERALLSETFVTNAEIDKLAKKLTAGASTPREKLDKLQAYVAQEIRYQQEYEDTIAGVKPHLPRVVMERGYGDCKDKAVLLLQLAKAVGVDLRFALLRTTPAGKVQQNIPNQQFNHAINYVPKQPGFDQGFFLDTTTNGLNLGNLRGDDQGATSLVLGDKEGFDFLQIPYQPVDLEYQKHAIAIDLRDPQKARATDRLELRGGAAAGLRVVVRSGAGAKKAYQAISNNLFSGTTLLSGTAEHDQDITKPLVVNLETDVQNRLQQDSGEQRFALPFTFSLAATAVLSTRQFPLVLSQGTLTSDINVDLPAKATRKPTDFKVEHACFSMERHVTEKANHVSVSTTLKVHCPRIEPVDYPAYRAAVQQVVAHEQDSIAFRSRP
jgi:tetratricopeptide (TPR) repeat protein